AARSPLPPGNIMRANCQWVDQKLDSRFRGNDIALKLFPVIPAQAELDASSAAQPNARAASAKNNPRGRVAACTAKSPPEQARRQRSALRMPAETPRVPLLSF